MPKAGLRPHVIGLVCGGFVAIGAPAMAQSLPDFSKLSIEELANVQVTSVSKRSESLADAPSAIFVITQDDIRRSGATSIPEALRLAPNLQVAQAGASRYVITARGFNGVPAAQNFSNKLLVLIDGRSVYTPLYSGVYWDMQDVPLQDVERIEVISGPGATLWGANAVNGVINIITRSSTDTQGGLVRAYAGGEQRGVNLRYGGDLGGGLTYRLYARTREGDDARLPSGAPARDGWSKPQMGFRLDWQPSSADLVTLQGDAYRGAESQASAPDEIVRGGNLLGRYTRTGDSGSSLQIQAYVDRAQRTAEVDGSGFTVDTYDLDVQHSFALGERHQIVWGGGYRVSRYRIDGTPTLFWVPPSGRLKLANAFVQDSITLSPALSLVLGAKYEDDPYVQGELLPNVRLAWTPRGDLMVWAAVSKAIRSPTPFDRDVVEKFGGVTFLVGGPDFRSEKLLAYELGTRLRPSSRTSLSLSAYYNDYDDLRSIEVAPGGFLPLRWGNGMAGRTYGLEAWGSYQATDWWRLSGGFSYLEERFRFKPGASGLLGVSQAANDPKYQASLRSSMDLGQRLRFDADLRYVSAMPNPRLAGYVDLDSRLAWSLTDQLEIAVTGRNLLHDQRQQYTGGRDIPRSVFVDLLWRF